MVVGIAALARGPLRVGRGESLHQPVRLGFDGFVGKAIRSTNPHHYPMARAISPLNKITDLAKVVKHCLLPAASHEVFGVLTKESMDESIAFRNGVPADSQILCLQARLSRYVVDELARSLLE